MPLPREPARWSGGAAFISTMRKSTPRRARSQASTRPAKPAPAIRTSVATELWLELDVGVLDHFGPKRRFALEELGAVFERAADHLGVHVLQPRAHRRI